MVTDRPEPGDDALRQMLATAKTIAVVGYSDKEDRPSNGVAHYLRKQGYRVIPVNPRLAGQTWDGQAIYSNLRDIPEPVDIVDVFRRADVVVPFVDDAAAIGAKVFWLQLGLVNQDARSRALAAGLRYVEDRCTQIEHLRLIRGYADAGSLTGIKS